MLDRGHQSVTLKAFISEPGTQRNQSLGCRWMGEVSPRQRGCRVVMDKCPECNHQVSKKAAFCPGCGRTIRETKPGTQWGTVIAAVVGILGVLLSEHSSSVRAAAERALATQEHQLEVDRLKFETAKEEEERQQRILKALDENIEQSRELAKQLGQTQKAALLQEQLDKHREMTRVLLQQAINNGGLLSLKEEELPLASEKDGEKLRVWLLTEATFQSNVAEEYLLRGILYYRLKDYELSLKQFDRAIEIKPTLASAHYNRGVVLAAQGRQEEARGAYATTVDLDPEFMKARMNLANTLHRLGRFNESLAAFSAAIKLRPYQPQLYFNRGICFYERDVFREALANFDKAAKLHPRYHDAYSMKGAVLYALERHADSLIAIQRAIELKPDDPSYHLNEGHSYYRLDRFEEAVSSFETTVGLDPKHVKGWKDLALTRKKLGKYSEAINAYSKVLELDPKNGGAYDGRATCHRLLGSDHYSEAHQDFDHAIDLGDKLAAFNKACLCSIWERERWNEALQSLKEALKSDEKKFGKRAREGATEENGDFFGLANDPIFGPRFWELVGKGEEDKSEEPESPDEEKR